MSDVFYLRNVDPPIGPDAESANFFDKLTLLDPADRPPED